jgi:1,4-alpha-glucan branching enzyme
MRAKNEPLPGDAWQKLANLRLLFAYQWTRPGKKLLFMGSELAPPDEWRHDRSLDWHLGGEPGRAGILTLVSDLGRLYGDLTALWRWDHDPDGFEWIDCSDRANAVVAYLRKDGDLAVLIVLNLTPVPRSDYRIGVPTGGVWRERLSTDAARYGGSGTPTVGEAVAEDVAWHGRRHSVRLTLPPLAALVLAVNP